MGKVVLTPDALRQFAELPRSVKPRVLGLFERLERWPAISGAKPLTGRLTGRYRLRTGDYRVQFRVDEGCVTVERIGHRDGFYED
jgi:mRNA-degrading endonuclease RelE of RelBE toxin-antitoxin system